jgi:hypothetical protein
VAHSLQTAVSVALHMIYPLTHAILNLRAGRVNVDAVER